MANAVTLKDKSGVECYPKSHVKQIVDSNGKTQDEINKEIDKKIADFGNKIVYETFIDITTIEKNSQITSEQQEELDKIFSSEAPVYLQNVGFYEKTTDGLWTKQLVIRKDSVTYIADVSSTIWSIVEIKTDKELNGESYNPIANAPVQKAITSLSSKVDTQLPAIEEAKNEAIESINQNEQSAISNFNAQRVTPEMLSESTKQLIEASGGGAITNLADDEDIESVDDGTGSNVLKFKNKAYSAENFSGLGRVYLRKNMVEGKNVLTQEMISVPNTIYNIQYDYDLNGAEITVPENCVLQFDGGCLSNGKITGNNTCVQSEPVKVFDNITFDGSFRIKSIFAEWFGAKGLHHRVKYNAEGGSPAQLNIPKAVDSLEDSSAAINLALQLSALTGNHVQLQSLIYRIDNTIVIDRYASLSTNVETMIVPYMTGAGNRIAIMDEEAATFSYEDKAEPIYTLGRNELLDTKAMAIAIKINPVRTRLDGGGSISLLKSRYTIGVCVTSEDWHYMDMTYMSPIIDIVTVGDKRQVYAPDKRDYVGEDAPDTSIGSGNSDTIYYYDKKNKKYYKRAKGGEWTLQSDNADPLWNTSLRFDIGNTGFARLINPQIKIKDIFGARGIEAFIRKPQDAAENPWFNQSVICGSVSEKYSHYMGCFCENICSMAYHDWSNIVVQSSPVGMHDGCITYLNGNCAAFKFGMMWDVSWLGSKAQYNYYMGKQTRSLEYLLLDGTYIDLGSNNLYPKKFDFSDVQLVMSGLYHNLFDKRFDENNGGSNVGGVFKEMPNAENMKSLSTFLSGQKPCKYLFDGDIRTQVRIIDTDNNKYGYGLQFGSGVDNGAFRQAINYAVIKITYIISKKNDASGKVKCRFITQGWRDDNFTNKSRYKEYDIVIASAENRLNSFYIRISPSSCDKAQLIIFAEEDIPGLTVDLVSVEYLIDSSYKDADKRYPYYDGLPNCAPNGFAYYDKKTNSYQVNIGDAENPQWANVPIEGQSYIEHGTNDTTITIQPSVFHIWDAVESLTVTLDKGNPNDEYSFQFSSGGNATVLTVNPTIKWINDSLIESNKTYQVSIKNNIGVIASV